MNENELTRWEKKRKKRSPLQQNIFRILTFILLIIITIIILLVSLTLNDTLFKTIVIITLVILLFIVLTIGSKLHSNKIDNFVNNENIYISLFRNILREKPSFSSKVLKIIKNKELASLKTNSSMKKIIESRYKILTEGDVDIWNDYLLKVALHGRWYLIEYDGIQGWIFIF